MIHFVNPEFFFLLAIIPFLISNYFRKNKSRQGSLRFSSLRTVKSIAKRSTFALKARHILIILRVGTVVLITIALARPQSSQKSSEIMTEGIDIVLSIDVSSSMLAEDFKPDNRLIAAKKVASDFIQGRKNDLIGLVVFAGKSFTQCPLTLDYGVLISFLERVKIGMVEDGTAIGMGIATALNRLRNSKAKSKVIILLTDGVNNSGQVDPITAAKAAKALNVRIYTIGAGTDGSAMYPVEDPLFGKRYVSMPVEIDEESLKEVAKITGGEYFRAKDAKSLKAIYKQIDQLEKTKIEIEKYTRYEELFMIFLLPAICLFILEIVLANTRFRRIP
ncbi:MAG: aerotolerance regulator BatA [Candidatus Cloacimonetes bacterium 4572_55]|nr:MAG: aerotolerance regulator BatA [Candidatus Cloacimonetes bacterium 4572_55]